MCMITGAVLCPALVGFFLPRIDTMRHFGSEDFHATGRLAFDSVVCAKLVTGMSSGFWLAMQHHHTTKVSCEWEPKPTQFLT